MDRFLMFCCDAFVYLPGGRPGILTLHVNRESKSFVWLQVHLDYGLPGHLDKCQKLLTKRSRQNAYPIEMNTATDYFE